MGRIVRSGFSASLLSIALFGAATPCFSQVSVFAANEVRAAGLKEPEFTISDGFALKIWRVPATEMSGKVAGKVAGKMSGKVAGKVAAKMAGKIIELIRENPAITIPELAKALKKPERTTERLLQALKSEEIIGRIGPARGGRWEVLE